MKSGILKETLPKLSLIITPLMVVGLLIVALFSKDSLLAVPLVAFLWLVVLKDKGYFIYALLIFSVTGILFLLHPVFWSGFLMVFLLVLLSTLPARKKEQGRWQIASKDGKLSSWFLPNSASEDIGAITGDASIHLIALAMILVALATWVF